jgi:hypothetical protein
MNVRWHGHTRVKLPQNRDAARRFVFVQDQQLDTRIRAGLPGLVFGQSNVLEHGLIQRRRRKIASALSLTM